TNSYQARQEVRRWLETRVETPHRRGTAGQHGRLVSVENRTADTAAKKIVCGLETAVDVYARAREVPERISRLFAELPRGNGNNLILISRPFEILGIGRDNKSPGIRVVDNLGSNGRKLDGRPKKLCKS